MMIAMFKETTSSDNTMEAITQMRKIVGKQCFISGMSGASVRHSRLDRVLVMDGCEVDGADLTNVILGEGCRIGKGAKVSNSVLADGTVVRPGEVLDQGRSV